MKQFIYILFLSISVGSVYAQQKPQYTQYLFNNYLLNPAFAGIDNYTDIKVGHRSQWTGLQGAPTTNYVSINTPIGKTILQQADTSKLRGSLFGHNTVLGKPHHGVGLLFLNDKAGLINQNNLYASYAYHLKLSNQLNLSTGITAGLDFTSLNTSLVTLENPNDVAVQNGYNGIWRPDVTAGILLYNSHFYAGVSVQQLLNQTFFDTNDLSVKSKTIPHLLLNFGYTLAWGDDFIFVPSLLFKIVKPVPTSFDVNMKLLFKNKLWLGTSYRRNDSFGILAGLSIHQRFNIGYAYDISTSPLNVVTNGSHEVVLGIMLNRFFNANSSISP